MKRHQQILAGILVLQIIVTVVVFWPKPVATEGGERLFPDVVMEDVVSLSIADDQGNSVVLEKADGEWVMPKADDYPAKSASITSTLSKTLQLETGSVVARTPASHEQLKVAEDDFVRRVIFETTEDKAYIFYVGTAPNYGATHVRLEGQEEVYLTTSISSWDLNATANSWVDPVYVSVAPQDVTVMTVENKNGVLDFTKAGDAWTMEGLSGDEEADATKISTLLNRAASVRMTRPLGKTEESTYGMGQPNARVTLVTTGTTHTLTIGTHDAGDNTYVVKASDSPYYVEVSAVNMERFVEAARDDFIKAEPTPTPVPEDE